MPILRRNVAPFDLTVVDQREFAPNRVRSLLRLVEHGERRWYVAEIDRIVDCGCNWNRAAELLAAAELPVGRERR